MIDSKQSSQFITHLLAHWDLETSRRHYTKKNFLQIIGGTICLNF